MHGRVRRRVCVRKGVHISCIWYVWDRVFVRAHGHAWACARIHTDTQTHRHTDTQTLKVTSRERWALGAVACGACSWVKIS